MTNFFRIYEKVQTPVFERIAPSLANNKIVKIIVLGKYFHKKFEI